MIARTLGAATRTGASGGCCACESGPVHCDRTIATASLHGCGLKSRGGITWGQTASHGVIRRHMATHGSCTRPAAVGLQPVCVCRPAMVTRLFVAHTTVQRGTWA
eukprot:4538052-Prymnesium_polylepis.3